MDDRIGFGQDGLQLTRRRLVGAGAGALLAATALGSTVARGATSTAAAGAVGEGKTIGLIVIGVNQYVQCLATGVLEELSTTKYNMIGINSVFDPSKEVAGFQTLISRKVDGILVLPVTPQSAARGTLAASKAGIPVVNLAWAKPTAADKIFKARIRIDNLKGGGLIADWIGKNTQPGEIVVVEGLPGNEFNDQLLLGLKTGIAKLGGGWKIAGVQPGAYARDKSITAVQNLLTAHPKAKIVVDFAAEMGAGIASYLERQRLKDIVHITSDANPEMPSWMKKGTIAGVRFYSSAE